MPDQKPVILIEACEPLDSDYQSYNPLHGDPSKYKNRAEILKEALEKEIGASVFINPGAPEGFVSSGQPQMYQRKSNPLEKLRYPRLGAMEVYLPDGMVIYSKLFSRKWPVTKFVVSGMQTYLERGQQKTKKKPTFSDEVSTAISQLSRSDINEIKAFAQPHPAINSVLSLVVIIMSPGSAVPQDISWIACRKMLMDTMFLSRIGELDVSTVSQKKIKAIQSIFMASADLNVETVASVSRASHALLTWVVGIVHEVAGPDSLKIPTARTRTAPGSPSIMERYEAGVKTAPKHPYQDIKDKDISASKKSLPGTQIVNSPSQKSNQAADDKANNAAEAVVADGKAK